jgi:uncharacterized protein YecE (DUF72 family)
VVDPFVQETGTPDKCYFRLHGREGWRYQYSVSELKKLTALLPCERSGYVFFNNSAMTGDALRLREILG